MIKNQYSIKVLEYRIELPWIIESFTRLLIMFSFFLPVYTLEILTVRSGMLTLWLCENFGGKRGVLAPLSI